MRSKVTLLLLFLNVALFFFIFYFEQGWRTERISMEARRRVLGPEAATIRNLEVSGGSPSSSFSIERRGEAWFVTKPVDWPANLNAVNRILNELQILERETSFSTRDLERNGQKLADYGLEQPRMIVSFTSGDPRTGGPENEKSTVLRIGDSTKVGDRLYLLSPDGSAVDVVRRSLAESLSVSFDQLRSDIVFSIPVFEARSLSLLTAAPSGVRVRLDREGSQWLFRTPVNARAGKNATELAINELNALRVHSFVLQNAPAIAPSAAPTLRVTLEGNNRHETLFVGGPAEGDHLYYAQLEDRNAIFTVQLTDTLMATLKGASDELRDRHILDFDSNAVTSIVFSAPNQPELALQRLEAPVAGTDAGWQIVRRDGGARASQPLPAESGAVTRLLEQLERLSALHFQSDAPTATDLEDWGFNRPEREVTLSLGGATPSQVTLQVGLPTRRDNVAYARIAGSHSVYAIEPDILRETNASPLAWRERLLATLPASARITSLTLSNAADGTAIYSRKLGDGDSWESALVSETPARRSAILGVIEHLRTLRAASFVQEGFADKVFAAGEVRSWKYRLDATVLLPGGNSGAQVNTLTLWLAERTGGAEQLAGSKDFGVVFVIEQPLLDALWTLTQP